VCVNGFGQPGDGSTTDRSSPLPVPGLTGAAAVAGELGHSLALKSSDGVSAWGGNDGQVGDKSCGAKKGPLAEPLCIVGTAVRSSGP